MNRDCRITDRRLVACVLLPTLVWTASCRESSLPPLADDAEVAKAADRGEPLVISRSTLQHVPPRTITLDGRFDDWADLSPVARGRSTYEADPFLRLGRVWCTFNDRWVYFRIELGRRVNIQGLTGTLSLQLDGDGNRLSGDIRTAGSGEAGLAGVDFELLFSPRDSSGGFSGVSAEVVEAGLPSAPANPNWFEASFAPTFASEEIELRMARGGLIPGATVVPFAGSSFTGRLVFSDETGSIIDRTEPFSMALPPLPTPWIELEAPPADEPGEPQAPPESDQAMMGEAPGEDDVAAGDGAAEGEPAVESAPPDAAPAAPAAPMRIARRDARDVRAVSWNVFNGALFADSAPFARLLTALHPEVICFQELGPGASVASLKAWLEENLPSAYGWEVMVEPESQVGVATRLAGVRARPGLTDSSARQPVRAASLLVAAANRRILVTSVHLRCCGRMGDERDRQRIAEADAVRRILRAGQFDLSPSGLLVMGDLNLVGSYEPLKIIQFQNDLNATDLLVVEPLVLGDETTTTWRDAGQPFLPGRLDYALLSDAVLTLSQSFILDTERLSVDELRRLGLERDDSRASDHLPVVVDFR